MPATHGEIVEGTRRVLTDRGPLDEEELVAALLAEGLDLGHDPEETVADLLDSDDLGLVMPLDDRQVYLPALLEGRTFTHRVTAAEVEHDFLGVSPDLEPVSLLTEEEAFQRLVDGTSVVEVIAGFDDDVLSERGIDPDWLHETAWLLEPDVLGRLQVGAGDLVAVTVDPDGFELTKAGEPVRTADPRPLTEAMTQLGHDHPAQIAGVVWLACADHPAIFTSPTLPLADLLAGAGLVVEGEQVGPPGFDFARWHTERRLKRIAEIHRLHHDDALAVLVLAGVFEGVADLVEHARRAEPDGEPITDLLTDGPPGAETADRSNVDPRGDRQLVREVALRLADPAVAEALLVETIGAGREGAAALGVFAETLEPQVHRRARPSLRWLQGKATERLGNATGAEQAYDAALAMDPDFPLALYDLARIASDRGDAERGLSLLRRAGAPDDDDLVVLLTHFRPVERRDLGRNDPCWCGSGRKYKVCHRGNETLPLADRAAWLYQKAGAYLADGPWRGDVVEAAEVRARDSDDPLATYRAVEDPLVCDAVLFEGGAFEAFLAERGGLLPDDERLLGEQWLLTDRSVHEVETVAPGSGFTARDLRTGDRLEVRERTASRTLRPGMLICARLVPAGDTTQCFGGLEPVTLHERDGLLELLDRAPAPNELVAHLSGRLAPPVLQNTEGEPLVLCSATLAGRDLTGLEAALDNRYDRQPGQPRWIEHVTTHGMERIRATVSIESDRVRVETNSEARMDRVLDSLLTLESGLVVMSQTRHPARDVAEAMSRAPGGVPAATLDPDDPQLAEALEQFSRAHEQAWLDEPIPALAGVTPREAAADPTRRPDLIRLLESFGPAGPGTMDPDRVRAHLDL